MASLRFIAPPPLKFRSPLPNLIFCSGPPNYFGLKFLGPPLIFFFGGEGGGATMWRVRSNLNSLSKVNLQYHDQKDRDSHAIFLFKQRSFRIFSTSTISTYYNLYRECCKNGIFIFRNNSLFWIKSFECKFITESHLVGFPNILV